MIQVKSKSSFLEKPELSIPTDSKIVLGHNGVAAMSIALQHLRVVKVL
jgi:hypothetical protein